jgi:hypothetical protein
MRKIAFAAITIVASNISANAQSLDQQERCAQQSHRTFQELDTKDRADQKQLGQTRISGDYQSHYHTKLGKCLMLIEAFDMLSGGQSSTSAYVMDANERRVYASYLLISRQDYGQTPPAVCELSPSLQEKKLCASREEFDSFIARYMEE